MPSRRIKKTFRRIIALFIFTTLLVFAGYVLYQWLLYRKAKFTHYREFGINIPDDYDIHGIDVSRYQQIIAWEEVRAMNVQNIRIRFAFIKATEGIGNSDPQFHRNWRKAKSNDIVRGAYHFFIASKDGKMQAENFIKRVDLESGDLPPVLDVEQQNGVSTEQIRREVRKWLATAENYYKVKPIIYTNIDFYKKILGSEFDQYPLWVAHYYEQRQPRISRAWEFWQHNDRGSVNGILSKVDFNVFKGDSLAFRQLLIR